jgi:hypothetical protein
MLFVTSTDTTITATPVAGILENLLFGGKAALPPRVVDVAPDRLTALAGDWRLPGGAALLVAAEDGALAIRPRGEEAFAALAALPPDRAAWAAKVSKRTAEIAAKAFAGDVTPLHEALGGALPIDAIRAQEANMMRDRQSRLGAFKGSAVVGALPRDAETLRVFVRLDFAERAVFNVYLWRGERILGLRGTPVLPPLRYLPVSESEFAAFSLDGGGIERRLRVTVRDGQARMVVGSPDAPVEALRSK